MSRGRSGWAARSGGLSGDVKSPGCRTPTEFVERRCVRRTVGGPSRWTCRMARRAVPGPCAAGESQILARHLQGACQRSVQIGSIPRYHSVPRESVAVQPRHRPRHLRPPLTGRSGRTQLLRRHAQPGAGLDGGCSGDIPLVRPASSATVEDRNWLPTPRPSPELAPAPFGPRRCSGRAASMSMVTARSSYGEAKRDGVRS